jgi:manganese efflux pump family protein
LKNAEIIIIAFGLAMDCLVVSIAIGATNPKITLGKTLEIALFFGLFQGLMPVIGWLLGLSFMDYIKNVDHWVAFGIFVLIGGKMIFESFKDTAEKKTVNIQKALIIIVLAIATSIDALVVGMSFVFLSISIVKATIIIGVITFLVTLPGFYTGKKFGSAYGKKAELLGGLVLVAIGTKILFEHLEIF